MTLVLTVVLAVLVGCAITAVIFYLVFFSQKKNEDAQRAQQREDLRSLLDLAAQKLETERVKQSAELAAQRTSVENTVEMYAALEAV